MSAAAASTLIRRVRLVRVGAPAPPGGEVDLRITGGVVRDVAARLRPLPGDEVVDAGGRWACPGLWDQHVHMQLWARSRVLLDVSGTAGPQAVTAIVRDHVTRVDRLAPDDRGSVVAGYGFRSATWPRPPTVAELDAVSGGHAVVLTSGDSHGGWLNTIALQRLGVPPRTGPLVENDWYALQPAVARLTRTADGETALRAAVQDAAAKGVVGIVDFEIGAGVQDWTARVADGITGLRVRPAVYPDRLDEALEAGLRTGDPLDEVGLLTMGPLKVISDGSLNTRTAHCREPYADAHQLESPHGVQNHSPAELRDLLRRAHDNGLTAAVHAIGDAAVAIAVDAFAVTGARGTVEHVQLARHTDLETMGRLGVAASVQPAHLLDDRDVTSQCWPDRGDRCFAFASMAGAGVVLAMGSDAPVARLDPWLAMAAAVHRSAPGDQPWNPSESLSVEQALAASTDGQQTLGEGGRGDIVLLSDDPLRPAGRGAEDAAAALRGMRVDATFVGGRPTHLAL